MSGRPERRHQCPSRLPSNFYWTGYGIEARDPEQPEWLKVETLCEAVAAGGDIRYQIQRLLAEVRKLDEDGATLEGTDLPELPSDWLMELRTRERCGLEGAAAEYRETHGVDWCAAVYLERYATMGPILSKIGLKVQSTQLPVIPLEKSGWPWATVKPSPKEYTVDGERVSEQEVAASTTLLAGAAKTVAQLESQGTLSRSEE